MGLGGFFRRGFGVGFCKLVEGGKGGAASFTRGCEITILEHLMFIFGAWQETLAL